MPTLPVLGIEDSWGMDNTPNGGDFQIGASSSGEKFIGFI
jgi:hypothetical protein